MRTVHTRIDPACRRGAAAVLVTVSLVVILGFGALAIDLGQLYLARAELQRAADAAALAGASAYFTDAGLAQDLYELEPMIDDRSQDTSLANPTHQDDTFLELADISIYRYDPYEPDWYEYLHEGRLNAVEVTVRRTTESTNGSISLYLAGVLGIHEAGVIASATAMANAHFAGLEIGGGLHPPFIPVTVNTYLYNYMIMLGPDEFSCEDGEVYPGPDGIREMNLYSWRINIHDLADPEDDALELSDQGAGNFALLQFDADCTLEVAENIEHNLTAEQLISEFGTSTLLYYSDDGGSMTYQLTGEQGLRVVLADSFSSRVGDVVGIFLHDQITAYPGADEFRNVGVRFGRIMDCELTGTSNKRLVFQPIAYTGSDVIVSEDAPCTGGQIGRVVLVR